MGTSIDSKVMGMQGNHKDKDYLLLWNVSTLLTPPSLGPQSEVYPELQERENGRSLETRYP